MSFETFVNIFSVVSFAISMFALGRAYEINCQIKEMKNETVG
jgi:hypothetical protein